MLKVARHIISALHWVVPHWGTLMELCVWGHSLCFQLLFSAKHTGCSIYIFLRRDKNSVNISPRSSCSALGSPAFPWLCGGWCALIVTTVARNSSKQSLNCHQIEICLLSGKGASASGSASVLFTLENIQEVGGKGRKQKCFRKTNSEFGRTLALVPTLVFIFQRSKWDCGTESIFDFSDSQKRSRALPHRWTFRAHRSVFRCWNRPTDTSLYPPLYAFLIK